MLTNIPDKGQRIYSTLLGALDTLNKWPIGDWLAHKGYFLLQDKTGYVHWITVTQLLTEIEFSDE